MKPMVPPRRLHSIRYMAESKQIPPPNGHFGKLEESALTDPFCFRYRLVIVPGR